MKILSHAGEVESYKLECFEMLHYSFKQLLQSIAKATWMSFEDMQLLTQETYQTVKFVVYIPLPDVHKSIFKKEQFYYLSLNTAVV